MGLYTFFYISYRLFLKTDAFFKYVLMNPGVQSSSNTNLKAEAKGGEFVPWLSEAFVNKTV